MSTINDFGIPGVAQGILHPKHKHRWRVRFAGIAGGNTSTALAHQLVTFERPKLEFEKVEVHRFNSRAFVAGKHLLQPISFTLEDDIKGTASTVIQQQVNMQQWLTGAEGSVFLGEADNNGGTGNRNNLGAASEGSVYKFTTYLEMMDGGRKNEVVERITVEGCYFENVDLGDVDYTSSEAVQVTCVLSFDHFRQDLGLNYSGAGSALGGQGG